MSGCALKVAGIIPFTTRDVIVRLSSAALNAPPSKVIFATLILPLTSRAPLPEKIKELPGASIAPIDPAPLYLISATLPAGAFIAS